MKRVLYVEDDDSQQKLMSLVVHQMDHWELMTCHTAEEALDRLSQPFPNVIVLDLGLPGMNGVDAARHLRSDQSTRPIPLIALSAQNGSEGTEPDQLDLFDAVVDKPFDVFAFAKMLEDISRASGV